MILETVQERADWLADEIRKRRAGLENERAQKDPASPHYRPSYPRAEKWIKQDECTVNGMKIALTFLLGVPMDMQLAEMYIQQDPAWRALLPLELQEEWT